MAGEENDKEEKHRYWQRGEEGRSSKIFITFLVIFVLLLIVVLSMGVYGYLSWMDYKKGPQVEIKNAYFQFQDSDGTNASFTVDVVVINEGKKSTGEIIVEWMLMESVGAGHNHFLKKGTNSIDGLDVDEEEEVTLDFNVSVGRYILAYRAYQEGLLSYEYRQFLEVSESEVSEGEPEAETIPEFSSLFIPISIVIILFVIYKRRQSGQNNKKRKEERIPVNLEEEK
ncbi:MAG: hypothetical protein R6U61_03060 [Thermoplasmata archaeon]